MAERPFCTESLNERTFRTRFHVFLAVFQEIIRQFPPGTRIFRNDKGVCRKKLNKDWWLTWVEQGNIMPRPPVNTVHLCKNSNLSWKIISAWAARKQLKLSTMAWTAEALHTIVMPCFERHETMDWRPMFQRPCGCYLRYTSVAAAVCDYDSSPSRKLVQESSEQAQM